MTATAWQPRHGAPKAASPPRSGIGAASATTVPTAGSRLHLPVFDRVLAHHFRRIHRLDMRRRHMERPRVVEPHGVFDNEASLGHVAVIRPEALERPLLVGRPDGAALGFALRKQR